MLIVPALRKTILLVNVCLVASLVFRVVTPVAFPLTGSVIICSTIVSVSKVNRPVACAAGNVEDWVEK